MRHRFLIVVPFLLVISAMMSGRALAAPPPNDDFNNATVITSLPFSDVLDTSEATVAVDDPSILGLGPTVWYALTPVSTMEIAVDTFGSDYVSEFGSDTVTEILVFSGSRGALYTWQNGFSVTTFTAQAGTTYHIMVAAYYATPHTLSLHLDAAQGHPAKQVIGQADFYYGVCNYYGVSASSLCAPSQVTVASNALYVVDRGNHRVLEYDSPLTSDGFADRVFGQAGGFSTNGCNFGGLSANSLCTPNGVAKDASGNLLVSDFANNRVLEYDTPLTTDTAADRVFGQPDFLTATCNTGGLSASSLCSPRGLAVDAAGSLYVADGFGSNHRLLVYQNPLVNAVADEVFGQPNFTTAGCNTGGISASSVCFPAGMAFDAAGNLYLADQGNNRVLVYFNPLLDNDVADLVIGQPDFASAGLYPPSASSLQQPIDVALDSLGNLYVADAANNRILVYRSPLSTDTVADMVYGQPDFTNGASNFDLFAGPRNLSSPRGIALDANDNLYVADLGNSRVLVYDTDIDFDGVFGAQDACPRTAPDLRLDADHNGCTDTIAGLKTIVQGLSIDQTTKNGLLSKLIEAQKALNRDNKNTAIVNLRDFIDAVNSKRGKKISVSDANLLVAYANNLIVLISS